MKMPGLTRLSSYLFFFLAAALLLAMSPTPAPAQGALIYLIDDGYGFPPLCNIGCFSADGESTPDDVRGATIFVGNVVNWTHVAQNIHTVTASTTQGDYQGHTCPEPGGLSALLITHEDHYLHQFMTIGDCYYRSTESYDQPNPSTGYPGMQGVIHVLPTTGPSAYWLMPVNINTLPSVGQTFTAFYVDPGGHANLSDTRLTLTGPSRSETLDYNPVTNTFTLQGAGGSCTPGQSATLSDGNLTLDCSQSSVLASVNFLQVTYNLTPQPSLSGYPYQLSVFASEVGGATSTKTLGTWTINRTPGVGSMTPMNSTTPVGTLQTFTIIYSDPDGYQNIAAANSYMSGNGGVENEQLHYYPAPNLFSLMGSNDLCNPGQAKTISSGYLTLNCATSTISGSGTTLTITFKVTPQSPASGIQYNIFNSASDQAGAAFANFGGSWQIP